MTELRAATRLDLALVARGLVATRARARDLVLRGRVTVDGAVVCKPAAMVGPAAHLAVAAEDEARMVSRGRLKLAHALDTFGLSPAGRVSLDVGASTGGFTELLLERGATRVYAVDVGRGQLHPTLMGDPRVVSLEGQDARRLTRAHVPEPVGAIVADVSFIPLATALPAALALAATDPWLVALVKPQFEVGPAHVGKSGLVRDATARAAAVARVVAWLTHDRGWRIVGDVASPITGGSGNVEHLLAARR
jgi:23S rRNA (cytidine1920-2'-O)/16S rRNA (cytidine1409-2'-O)-methyltransferase